MVDLGDLGVDLFSRREPVGPLLTAIAGQVTLADEAGHPVADFDLDPVVEDSGDRTGDDGALLHLGDARSERIVDQLLHTEADPFLLHVDVEQLGANGVSLGVFVRRFIAGLGPREVGEVDHAVDVTGQSDEQAELGDVLDIALDHRAHGIVFEEGLPGIAHALLEAEADPTFLLIDVEDHHLHLLTGGDDLAGVHVLLGPAHFGDMDQPFDPRLQLDEGAVIGDVGHPAGKLDPDRVFYLDAVPGVRLELLHAE